MAKSPDAWEAEVRAAERSPRYSGMWVDRKKSKYALYDSQNKKDYYVT